MFLLACRRGVESRYASLCYPTRSIIQIGGRFTLDSTYWTIPFNAQTIPFNAQTEGDLCRSFLMLSNFSCT